MWRMGNCLEMLEATQTMKLQVSFFFILFSFSLAEVDFKYKSKTDAEHVKS